MGKKFLITLVIIVAVGGVVILLNSNVSTSEELGNLGQSPDLVLEDYEGNEFSLSSLRGKVSVINSWAVWCPFCRDELPDFAELQKEFKEDIVVVAIDRRESREKAKGYTDSLNITDEIVFLLDPDDSFYRAIGGFSMPETIFVDEEGTIRIHKRGPMPLSEMREKVESLITASSQ